MNKTVKILNGSGQTVHKMSGRHGITGILQYWLCVKMPAAVRVHRRIERKVCQQISGWPRSCSCRNASKVQELDRITVVSITAFVPPGYACQQCPLCASSGSCTCTLMLNTESRHRWNIMLDSVVKTESRIANVQHFRSR